jgi:hypothetical protein
LDFLWEFFRAGWEFFQAKSEQCADIHCLVLFVFFGICLLAGLLFPVLLYRDIVHPLKDYSGLKRIGRTAEALQKTARKGFTALYDRCVEKVILRTFARLLDRRTQGRNASTVYRKDDRESLGRVGRQRNKTGRHGWLRIRAVYIVILFPAVCFLAALDLLYWCWRVFQSAADPSAFAEYAIELANAHAVQWRSVSSR